MPKSPHAATSSARSRDTQCRMDRIGHAVLVADLGQRRAFHLHRLHARRGAPAGPPRPPGVDELVAAGHHAHVQARRGHAEAGQHAVRHFGGEVGRRKSSAAARSAAVSSASAGNSARASSGTSWRGNSGRASRSCWRVRSATTISPTRTARPHAAGQPREHDLVHAELADQRTVVAAAATFPRAPAPAPPIARGACQRSSPACRWCARWRAPSCRMAAISPSTSSWSAARMPRVMAARIDEKGASIPAPGARRKPGAAFSEPLIGTGRPLCYSALAFAFHRFPSHSSPGEFRWNPVAIAFRSTHCPAGAGRSGAPRIALTRRALARVGLHPAGAGRLAPLARAGAAAARHRVALRWRHRLLRVQLGRAAQVQPSSGCWRVC